MVGLADGGNALRIGTTAIEMDNHHGTGARSDGLLYQGIIYLQGVEAGLHQHRLQTVLGDRKDGGDVGVGRHDDLVTLLQHIIIYVRTEEKCEGIEAVGYADTVLRADELCIFSLETLRSLATQIPAGVNDATRGFVNLVGMHRGDALQGQVFYHSVHS